MMIGVLGTAAIAFRRFMPSLMKCGFFEFGGVASRDIAKTSKFTDLYGGKGYDSYESLLDDSGISCVYIPLPPALHYTWAKKALERGKHVMLEKPFTISLKNTSALIEFAKEKKLALHENYMFQYHGQIDWIKSKIPDLGDLRLIRIDFGFPFRGAEDFRYNKSLGGGALFDCGGYTIKLASMLLGDSARLISADLQRGRGLEVDLYGNAVLTNDEGLTAQISFGMDNEYRCSLDIWGARGSLSTDRVFTAPADFEPVLLIKSGSDIFETKLPADDAFEKSMAFFQDCILNKSGRELSYTDILRQSELIEDCIKRYSGQRQN